MANITGELKKAITFTQILKVDGANALNLTASINSDNPENYTMNRVILSQPIYRANRDALNALQAAFEDAVWAEQQAVAKE